MSGKLILYGNELSPSVRAVLLTLKALNLDYIFKYVNVQAGENKSVEYLKMNPQHTIPTLEDDGKCIWDSHAICAYLARKYGKSDALYPKDYYQRAVVDQRLHYENGVIFMTIIKQALTPLWRGNATEAEKTEIYAKINENYDMLECFLADQPYFAGANLTIADLSLVTTISTLELLAPIESNRQLKLAAWLERMKQLPYYEEANGKGAKLVVEFIENKSKAAQN